MNFQGI